MTKKTKNIQYYEAVGRRKSAIARVRLYIVASGKTVTIGSNSVKGGQILINDKPIETVYPNPADKVRYLTPLTKVEAEGRFAVTIKASGGGREGRLDAITLGLSRALEKVDSSYRGTLKASGLLTRDPRIRERRKVGTGGKARRQKQSPKR